MLLETIVVSHPSCPRLGRSTVLIPTWRWLPLGRGLALRVCLFLQCPCLNPGLGPTQLSGGGPGAVCGTSVACLPLQTGNPKLKRLWVLGSG